MEEKKNTTFIILVIVLTLIVVGLAGYIIYDKVISDKEEIKETEKKEEREKQKEEEKKEEAKKEEEQKKETIVSKDKNIKYKLDEMKLVSLVVNGVEEISNVTSTTVDSVEYELKSEFVIFNIKGFWTCGHGEDELLIFDYEGNLIYSLAGSCDKEGVKLNSSLIYKGE